jgi:phosphatidylglycerophosphate synthase
VQIREICVTLCCIGHDDRQQNHDSANPADSVFCRRIDLLPPNRQRSSPAAGLLSFAVTAILDGVDGYIARRYNQKSELGAILDPLADKLLLVSAIVTLSFNHGAVPRANSALAHRHHPRTRFAAAHRHCRHPASPSAR